MEQTIMHENATQLRSACCSDRGRVRGNNEDNIYFDGQYLDAESDGTEGVLRADFGIPENASEGGILFAVFDGVGGSQCGEYASYIAAHTADAFRDMILDTITGDDREMIITSLDMLYADMNIAVFHGSIEYDAYDMGTTSVSLFFYAGRAWCSNVGDSRCYLLRDDTLSRISEDHTTEAALAALGFTGVKPQLTQFVGMDPEEVQMVPSHNSIPFAEGDIFLLCSDGLTDMVKEDRIRQILSESEDPAENTAKLVEAAIENGGRDNVTVIVIHI